MKIISHKNSLVMIKSKCLARQKINSILYQMLLAQIIVVILVTAFHFFQLIKPIQWKGLINMPHKLTFIKLRRLIIFFRIILAFLMYFHFKK